MARVLSGASGERVVFGRLLSAIAACVVALGLSSCNTVEGMGEDVSAAGGAVSGAAEDVEEEM
jgi:predicted small secreted protein